MNNKTPVGFYGKFHIKIHRDGKLINEQKGKNLVVDSGLKWILERLSDVSVTDLMTNMAIGSSSTAVLPTDAALIAETAATRNVASVVLVLLNQLTLTFSLTSPGSSTMREMGIFTHLTPSSSVMISRFLTQEVDLVISDVIGLTWVLQATGAS
jgi:hypothetical protein